MKNINKGEKVDGDGEEKETFVVLFPLYPISDSVSFTHRIQKHIDIC